MYYILAIRPFHGTTMPFETKKSKLMKALNQRPDSPTSAATDFFDEASGNKSLENPASAVVKKALHVFLETPNKSNLLHVNKTFLENDEYLKNDETRQLVHDAQELYPDLIPTIEAYQQKELENISDDDEAIASASISDDRKAPVENLLERRLLLQEMQNLENKIYTLKNAPYETRDLGTIQIRIDVRNKLLAEAENQLANLNEPKDGADEYSHEVWYFGASKRAVLEAQQYIGELYQEKENSSNERSERKEKINDLYEDILEIKEKITDLNDSDQIQKVSQQSLPQFSKNMETLRKKAEMKANIAQGREMKASASKKEHEGNKPEPSSNNHGTPGAN